MDANDLTARVAELESLARSQAERIATQSELLSRTAELRALLAPLAEFVRRVGAAAPDATPVSLGVSPVMGQCCTLGDLRRLATLAGGAAPGESSSPAGPAKGGAAEGPVMGAEDLE